MRRVPRVRVGVSVVLGVMLTLGVAWVVPNLMPENSFRDSGFILVDEPRIVSGRFQKAWYKSDLEFVWYTDAESAEMRQPSKAARGSQIDWDPKVVRTLPWWVTKPNVSPSESPIVLTVASGFPFRCVKTERIFGLGQRSFIDDTGVALSVPSWLATDGEWRIATAPIWLGLLANCVFWSALAAFPIFVPRCMSRQLRQRRGCCIACGYDLTGVTDRSCPECGQA